MSRDPLWYRWLSYRLSAQLSHPQGEGPVPNLIGSGIFPRIGERVWDLDVTRLNLSSYPYLGIDKDLEDWDAAAIAESLFDNFSGAIQ